MMQTLKKGIAKDELLITRLEHLKMMNGRFCHGLNDESQTIYNRQNPIQWMSKQKKCRRQSDVITFGL